MSEAAHGAGSCRERGRIDTYCAVNSEVYYKERYLLYYYAPSAIYSTSLTNVPDKKRSVSNGLFGDEFENISSDFLWGDGGVFIRRVPRATRETAPPTARSPESPSYSFLFGFSADSHNFAGVREHHTDARYTDILGRSTAANTP